MESEESSYSNKSKTSIAHLLDNSSEQSTSDSKRELKLNNILNHSTPPSPSSTQALKQNQQNDSTVLSSVAQLAEVSEELDSQTSNVLTQHPSSISTSVLASKAESAPFVTPVENEISAELESGFGFSVGLDGKKKRGRPRLHPEVSKVKKSTRGRPRSETSKRALKEAAKVAAQTSTGSTENENEIPSVNDSNESTVITQTFQQPQDDAVLVKEVVSELTTVGTVEKPTLDIENTSQVQESDENSASAQTTVTKRKASESSTPILSESKLKSKKIKKEKSLDKKQANNISTASPLNPIDSGAHASEAEVDGFSSHTAPPPKKKRTTDNSKRIRKTPNGTNDSYQQSHDYHKDESNSYCICRKGETGEWMIACDKCDEWFHGSCVNLTESKAQLLVKYVCSKCTESTQLTSIFKRKCRLPGCDLPVEYEKHGKSETNPTPISKYCSTDHGVQFFKNLINKAPTQKVFDPNVLTSSQLGAFINSCKSVKQFHRLGAKFPAAKMLPSEKEIEASFSESDKNLVSQLQLNFDDLQEKLKFNELKAQFIGQCKERAKIISEELIKQGLLNGDVDEEPKRNKKKKKQPKSKRDICGYNFKLTLGDEEWIEFINSDLNQTMLSQDLRQLKEQDRAFTCLNDKRKCSRHNGWQSLSSEFCANMERFYTIEQEKIKSQISEIYYKQQVQLMTLSGNKSSGNDNQTITC